LLFATLTEEQFVSSVGATFAMKLGEVLLDRLKVVIADDNPAVLRQLVVMLSIEFDVVATAENGLSAYNQVRQHKPDVAVLDLRMPGLDGNEVASQIRDSGLTSAIVICSVETDPGIVKAGQQAGALGYVFKINMAHDLIPAVKAAARGETFVSGLDPMRSTW
jgi:two-component system, NarL family, nitrate/nitrite response regulator NarL